MKKIISFSLVFALIAGAVFAADLGVDVIGKVRFLQGTSGKDKYEDPIPIEAGGNMERLRISGSADVNENFGAWIRFDGHDGFSGNGYAWWKPIDMFKLIIGGNPDAFYGKQGNVGWGFYGAACDAGVANSNSVWGDPGTGGYWYGNARYGQVFWGGFGGQGALMEIRPMDVFGLNVVIPYMKDRKAEDVYTHMVIQADVNLDFGNIALTFVGGRGHKDSEKFAGDTIDNPLYEEFTDPSGQKINNGQPATITYPDYETDEVFDPSKFYLYFGFNAIENLTLDFGLSFAFPISGQDKVVVYYPMGIGVGAKYNISDAFGVSFRTVMTFAGRVEVDGKKTNDTPFEMIGEIMPFFVVSDNIKAFLSVGLGITGGTEKITVAHQQTQGKTDPVAGWHINPYVEISSGGGPTFFAGVQFWSDGFKYEKGIVSARDPANKKGDGIVNWAIPIGMVVSF